jgi:murein DD-endopeptidase MepM/ murein hydrolase activator NlpD
MSWEQVWRRILQPVWDENAKVTHVLHMTSPPGLRYREKLHEWENHPGADLNYEGGQALPLNRSYPAIRSPVSGVVTQAGEGDYGTIAIQDENGLSHQILHTHTRHVAVGDPVVAGQLIGTMGNTG